MGGGGQNQLPLCYGPPKTLVAIGLTRVLSNGRIEFIYNQYPVFLEMDDKRVQVFFANC